VNVVEACVEADCIILPQGQNTGLTGGSVPRQNETGRPVVLISFKHLDAMFPIDDGQRVVCMAGVGLASVGCCRRHPIVSVSFNLKSSYIVLFFQTFSFAPLKAGAIH
jgi:hypothetical protein